MRLSCLAMRMRVFACFVCCASVVACRPSTTAQSVDAADHVAVRAMPTSSAGGQARPSRAFRCAQVEDEMKAEFDRFLSQHRACKDSRECALADTDCPLGCYHVAVAAAAVRETKIVSQRLLARFEAQDCGCVYKCFAPERAECVDGRCVARPLPPPG